MVCLSRGPLRELADLYTVDTVDVDIVESTDFNNDT